MNKITIPVGTSNFREIRKENYYYIDKSGLIENLLTTKGIKVVLITRPRRFGKTLNMNMLAEFFDIRKDSKELFTCLAVSANKDLCDTWMNQYPLCFISFKSVDGLTFSNAYAMLAAVMAQAYQEHLYLLDSDRLNSFEKETFCRIASKKATMEEVQNSLLFLTKMIAAHHGKPMILLLDEYDVPLAKASDNGYYPEMLEVIKGIMQAIKDNHALKFAVITGCLRIAKESIFTGANNFVSDTISDTRLNQYFGFTQDEIDKLLLDTKMIDHREEMKTWYDGYLFGSSHVYCPWDVVNHVQNLLLDASSVPKNFWENTSGNTIIRSFLNRTDYDITEKFETLLSGGYIKEKITDNLTYDTLRSSEENLWSLLYLTGYLTRVDPVKMKKDELLPGQFALKIPNLEIMDLFKKHIVAWFTDRSASSDRQELFDALWNEDTKALTSLISDLLFDTISYHDYRESFYHAFLTGLFSKAGYQVESNYENGLGRSDLVIKDRRNRRAVVIEAKWTDSESRLEKECADALRQIEKNQYAEKIERAGFRRVGRLGIAFFQKKCLVQNGHV